MPRYLLYPSMRELPLDGEPFASEGEADLWRVERMAVKRYREPTAAHGRKLLAMIKNPALKAHGWEVPDLAWPEELLIPVGVLNGRKIPHDNEIVGYTMPYLFNMQPLALLLRPAERQRRFPHWTYRHSLHVAMNLARTYDRLHRHGVVLGDPSPMNVMVNAKARTAVIDLDSAQITESGITFPCPVSTPDYTPPELQLGGALTSGLRTKHQDAFGIAGLLFQTISEGTHPFAGRVEMRKAIDAYPPDVPERISQNLWPYSTKRRNWRDCLWPQARRPRITPPKQAVPFGSFPLALQGLFIEAFDGGFVDPARRPGPAAFAEALETFINELNMCPASGGHFYHRELNVCPWCNRTRPLRWRRAGRFPVYKNERFEKYLDFVCGVYARARRFQQMLSKRRS